MSRDEATERAALQAAIERFAGDDGGRSAALRYRPISRDGAVAVTLHANGETLRPVASVIKVALVMALYDLDAAGVLSLGEQVPVGSLGATRYCSIMKAFDCDRSLSLAELAALALITSDNPAAVMIEDRVGYDAVNAVLKRAGLAADRQMRAGFRETELGPANRANQLTVLDTIALFDLLASQPRYQPVVVALENNLRNARIPALLPDEAVIAHKTGSLEGVVNDAGIVRLGETAFTVAFLTDGQADAVATSTDIATCVEALYFQIAGGQART